MYIWNEPQLSVLRVNCAQTPEDLEGISFPAAAAGASPAWFAAFSPGQSPPRAVRCCLHAPSPRASSAGLGVVPEHPPPPPRPAGPGPRQSRTSGEGSRPSWVLVGPRKWVTWSGADKGPPGRHTRSPPELPPSGDRGSCWERAANLCRWRVPALSVRRRLSAS